MFSVLTLALVAVLILKRKKIAWGSVALGVILLALVIGTPIGTAVTHSVTTLADAGTAAFRGLLAQIGVHV